MVFSGFVTAWRLATWPTKRSPFLVMATMDGVSRAPSLFSSTVGSPASIIAITELVLPRSIPSTFGIIVTSFTRIHALLFHIFSASPSLLWSRWTCHHDLGG